MATTNPTMDQQITNLVNSIIAQVESTRKAETHYKTWYLATSTHFSDLELLNPSLPSPHLQTDNSAHLCNFRIQAHDMQMEILDMQARVKAARRQLCHLLQANGDEEKLIDDVDAEGWIPNIDLLRRRLAAEEVAASPPSLVISTSSASSPDSDSEIDTIDEAEDNYGYPLPRVGVPSSHVPEACEFNQSSTQEENLTPSQITALLRLWGCDFEEGLVNARFDEYVRTQQVCLVDSERRIYAWMDGMDGICC